MNTTKFWFIEKVIAYGYGSMPVALFASEQDAEFYKWKKNNERNSREARFWASFHGPIEISLLTVDKSGKEFEKFKKERLAEIEKQIEAKSSCSKEDRECIEALEKEKEIYK